MGLRTVLKYMMNHPLNLLCAMCLLVACGSPPPVNPAKPPQRVELPSKKVSPPRKAKKRPSNLNEAFNLKAAKERLLGFPLPLGVEAVEGKQSRKIVTTQKRILRFYASRGHVIQRELDGWSVKHTKLTLANAKDKAGSLYRATLYINPRPGYSYLLRFNSGRQRIRPELPLTALMRRETERSQVKPAEHSPKRKSQKPALIDDKKTAKKPPAVPLPASKTTGFARHKSKKLKRFSLERLRKTALGKRPRSGRSRNISKRIYKWHKANKGRRFLD
jgi:hypothetical protein